MSARRPRRGRRWLSRVTVRISGLFVLALVVLAAFASVAPAATGSGQPSAADQYIEELPSIDGSVPLEPGGDGSSRWWKLDQRRRLVGRRRRRRGAALPVRAASAAHARRPHRDGTEDARHLARPRRPASARGGHDADARLVGRTRSRRLDHEPP